MPTVYITAPPDAADDIVDTLLEERLAACVNRVPCESSYRWEGAVHHDEETLLFVKTTDGAYAELVERVRAVHPHEVPCIERFDPTDGHDPFMAWIDESVGPKSNP